MSSARYSGVYVFGEDGHDMVRMGCERRVLSTFLLYFSRTIDCPHGVPACSTVQPRLWFVGLNCIDRMRSAC